MKRINSKFIKKIQSKKGESLVEILITILLVGLVSAGFLVVVQTAQSMSKQVVEVDNTFYDEMSKAESMDFGDTPEDGNVKIHINNSGNLTLQGTEINIPVETYKGSYGLYAYKIK